MTAQICDRIVFAERKYTIATSTSTPFHPRTVGLKVTSISTACRIGYHCDFVVSDDALFLTRLTVGLTARDRKAAESRSGPVIFGVLPIREQQPCEVYDPKTQERTPSTYWSDWFYEPAECRIPFSGTLTVGADFIQELYVHAGKQAAFKYREVHDLAFSGGRLVNVHDRSSEMAKLREVNEARSTQGFLKGILNALFKTQSDSDT